MKRNNHLITWSLLLVLVLVLLSFVLSRRTQGSVTLVIPHAGSEVFIDTKLAETTISDNQEVSFRLKKGDHSFLVGSAGRWPWIESFELRAQAKHILKPFLIPQNQGGFIIGKEDPEYASITQAFATYVLPGSETKILSEDGNLAYFVSADGRDVISEWRGDEDERPAYFCTESSCVTTLTSFTSVEPIRTIAFFPGRDDVFVIGVGQGVYVVEADPTEVQNFQQLSLGTAPKALVREASIYTLDQGILSEISY